MSVNRAEVKGTLSNAMSVNRADFEREEMGGKTMLVEHFSAQLFATNCWVIAPKAGSECVVIDPGMPDVSQMLEDLLAQHSLKPVAVIATHGHLDHTFSIQPISDGYSIPTYIHSQDRDALANPERLHGRDFIATYCDSEFVEPKDVRELRNGEIVEIVGMKFKAIHAPGHTAGSLMFDVDNEILVSGDVLFSGSIGRTDTPSGSDEDMEQTLRKKVLTLPDHLRVLPGHGRETTIGIEKKNNPFLKALKGRY